MYRLIGRLETGELSELYRAEREADGQAVAIKLFHPKTSDLAYARVMADVAKQLQRVNHPGIAHVLAIGRVQKRLAIVREDLGRYTLGQVLTRLYTREVHLPPAPALAIAIALTEALQAAHAQGVIHGAVTPGNVLVGADGQVAVCDFAALDALQASAALKKTFGARGRGGYRAPELKGSERGSVATDVYAAGAIAYELLTLREPTMGAASVSTRNQRQPPPSRLVRSLNTRLDAIVMRAIEAAPSRRYRTCGELAAGLRDYLGENGGMPSRDELRRFVDEVFPRDVVLDALGPVPWDDPFELEDVGGTPTLTELPIQDIAPRSPFSGGEVTERTQTSDGLPVFAEGNEPVEASIKTVPEGREPVARAEEWVAPAGEMPAVSAEAAPSSFQSRVKVVEDFGALEETKPPERGFPTIVAVPKADPAKGGKTLLTFVTPFKRTDVPEPPDLKAMALERKRRARIASATGSIIVTSFLVTVIVVWLMYSRDPLGDLIVYLPQPIQDVIPHTRRPGPPGPPLKALRLPDFDKLRSNRAQRSHKKPQAQKVLDAKPLDPKIEVTCYVPAGSAFLTVPLSAPARVELDGVTMCGAVSKIAVTAGSHKVRVVDAKSGREYVSTARFQAGKLTKLVPVFKTR